MKILVIGGSAPSLVNFRGPLLQTLVTQGHAVSACADGPASAIAAKLRSWGVTYRPIRLSRAGMNPLADLYTLLDLIIFMRRIRPDMVLSYTIKPVIYGSYAAKLCGIRANYSMIEGLGYAFAESSSLRRRILRLIAAGLYKIALKNNRRVFFLNPDDQEQFLALKLVRQDQTCLINGAGVDLDHFAVTPLPAKEGLCFLLVARLLRDKGVGEYAEAARLVKLKYPQTRFLLAGDLDPNPACITRGELSAWIEAGLIEYLGYLEDVRPAIARSSVYVLPSYYREGTPRTVLEAMAMGRSIITTDAPGCRETIKRDGSVRSALHSEGLIEGENGFLVPPKNVLKLAEAIERFIVNPELVNRMGAYSYQMAVEKYDVHKVNMVILKNMELECDV